MGGMHMPAERYVMSYELDEIFTIAAQIEKGPTGFPQVRLEVANKHGDPTSMELRTIFRDMQGLHVHTTSWKPAVVPANATYTYKAECPVKEATDYQVQIKTLE